MIDGAHRLQLKSEEIAGKVIDGEAIVMHLGTGVYYSMNAVASRVWELSQEGLTLDDVARAVAHDFDVSFDRAREGVMKLAGELIDQELVVAINGERAAVWSADGPGTDRPYDEPEIEKYADMADLLALDPPMPGVGETPWKDKDEAG